MKCVVTVKLENVVTVEESTDGQFSFFDKNRNLLFGIAKNQMISYSGLMEKEKQEKK